MMAISLVNKEDVNWDGGAIVKDISDTVQGCKSCQFQYAGRKARLAHDLVKWEGNGANNYVWEVYFPLLYFNPIE